MTKHAVVFLSAFLFLSAHSLAQQERTQRPERGLVDLRRGALDGYTLIAPLLDDRVYLIDMGGQVAHQWEVDWGGDGGQYLLEGGRLLRAGLEEDNPRFHGGGIGGRIQEYDWTGERTWLYIVSDDKRSHHHDVEVLPNGNVLLVAWEYRSPEEAIAAGRDPQAVGDEGIWPDMVMEVKPTRPEGAEIVWEWHAWDHLVQDFDEERDNYGSVYEHPERIDLNADHRDEPPMSPAELAEIAEMEEQMRAIGYVDGGDEEGDLEPNEEQLRRRRRPDWLHVNAVAYNAEHDLIVLCSPRFNEIWVIDHSTTTEEAAGSTGGRFGRGGELLYRYGNPKTYGRGTNADQHFFFQHNPTWLESSTAGELRLLVFNNGMRRPDGDYSTIEELVLPFDPERGFLREDDDPFGPAEPVWSYTARDDYFSPYISGAQRLSNGNTLICSGVPGRIFEVTPAGEIVWDYRNPYGDRREGEEGQAPPTAVFRATRIAVGDERLRGRF